MTTLRRIGFSVIVGLLALRVTPANGAVPASSDSDIVRPLQGTLEIQIPIAIVGSHYWIYVNHQIMNAPPHAERPDDLIVVAIENNGWEGWDPIGLAWKYNNGRFYNVRAGTLANALQTVTLHVKPGTYSIELLALSNSWHQSPFDITTPPYSVTVSDGDKRRLMMEVPHGFKLGPQVASAGYSDNTECADKDSASRDLDEAYSHLDAWAHNATLQPLLATANALAVAPPIRPSVMIALPSELGGTRELDAEQLNQLVYFLGPVQPFSLDSAKECIALLPGENQKIQQMLNESAFEEQQLKALRNMVQQISKAKEP